MTVRSYTFINGPETDSLPSSGIINSTLVSTKSADYVVTDTDSIGTILVDDTSSNRTITLPTVSANTDRKLLVVNTSSDGGTVTVDGEGAETIDGQLTVVLYNRYDSISIQCDGTSWYSIAETPKYQIQDFTTIAAVGTASQQAAGHIYITDILGSGTDLAYYKFANGAMTTDTEGAYTLTDPGGADSPTNANGITGSDFAASFAGGDYYTQPTLLDAPSGLTNGLGISLWIKADDGQAAATQVMVAKVNDDTGGNQDYLFINLKTTGEIQFNTSNSGATNAILSSTLFPNGATGWYHVVVNWDVTNGKRLWVNGVLEAQAGTATTLMSDGTTRDFIVGASNSTGSISSPYTGDLALLQVHDIKYTQKDVDLLYSVRYTKPAIFTDNSYKLNAYIQKDGSSSFERPYIFDEVKRDSSYVYRAGYTDGYGLSATDKLKIVGER